MWNWQWAIAFRRRDMINISRRPAIVLLLITSISLMINTGGAFSAIAQSNAPPVPPKEWIDPDTGHRVIRLTEDSGGASLYFHQNGYTASGDKLVITTRAGLSTINLKTRRSGPRSKGGGGN